MTGISIAKRYAKALFSLAKEQGMSEATGEGLSRVETFFTDPSLTKIFALPTLDGRARQALARRVVESLSLSPLLATFVRFLAAKNRLRYLPGICRCYRSLLDQELGRGRALVRVASPISEAEAREIAVAFSHLTGREIVPTVEVDAGLLGGNVVVLDGTVYDGSVKTQLARLKEEISQNRGFYGDQGRRN